MKLELKHIAAYLPYNLDVEWERCIYPKRKENIKLHVTDLVLWDNKSFKMKPILRPLSYLTKEIEVNGEKFVPLIELSRDFVPIEFKDCVQILSTDRANYYEVGYKYSNHYFNHRINKDPKRMEYNCIQKLYEWHFDIHGLIEYGLAIDIKNLK